MKEEQYAGHVATYVRLDSTAGERKEALNFLVIGLHRQALTLRMVVQMLGDSLTTFDDGKRARAVLFLAEVLTRLPQLPLNRESIQFLLLFFCNRLQDYPCQSEVLRGLHALIQHHTLEAGNFLFAKIKGDEQQVCRSIFAEVHVQSVPLRERLFVFEIFDILLSKYVKNLAKMGLDFVGGYLRGIVQDLTLSGRRREGS